MADSTSTTSTTSPTSVTTNSDLLAPTPIEYPNWMVPEDISATLRDIPRFPKSKAEQQLVESTYNSLFEYILDYIAAGVPLTSVLKHDPRNIDYARFKRWINKNPMRKARFEEAEEIAADIMIEQLGQSIDVSPDELAGSMDGSTMLGLKRLNFEYTKFRAGAMNKRKYGSNKHVELTTNYDEDALKDMSVNDLKRMLLQQEGIDPSLLETGDE